MRSASIWPLAVAVLGAVLLAACGDSEPEPTPSLEPGPIPTAALAPEPTETPVPDPTATPEPTSTPSAESAPQSPQPLARESRTDLIGTVESAPCGYIEFSSAFPEYPAPVAECGFLTVLEDRSKTDGPTIRIHYAVFRSFSDAPLPDPVVYLEGGPGGHALQSVPLVFEDLVEPFLSERDFIMFDQRGVGYSEPALTCPEQVELRFETLDLDLRGDRYAVISIDALIQCHDRLRRDGIDLSAYNSAENAADLEDLRKALGYDQWNLFGVSYGTRFALTAMRDYPGGIRSVILDSTYTPDVDLFTSLPESTNRVLRSLFDGCAADQKCNETYPDLEGTFFDLVERLNTRPVITEITHALTGDKYDYLTNGNRLLDFVFESFYATELIPLIPKLILDVRDGDYDTYNLVQGSLIANADFLSWGMYYSVQCAEEVAFSSRSDARAASDEYPELREFVEILSVYDVCDHWQDGDVDPIENQPVTSDIPTLVLAGELDPITPSKWGSLAAGTLSNSYFIEFPGMGHGVAVTADCPLSIALAFLSDPLGELDRSCTERLEGLAFIVEAQRVTLVPYTDEVQGLRGVRPEEWIEIEPGVYGRSALGVTAIIQQVTAGVEPGQILVVLAGQFGMAGLPEIVSTRNVDGLNWMLYEMEIEQQTIDLALAASAGRTLWIMLTSTPNDRASFYDDVFIPAIDAFEPI